MTVKPRRGIYLLPNLFTLTALFAGYYSIIAAHQARYVDAAIAIFVAMLFDGLDGRVARLTNSQTDFGAQLDSLSDMVSFGVAPALVCYFWSLQALGKLGWLASFVYTVAVVLRLARFNVRLGNDKRYFQGLACTPAAGIIAGFIWVATDLGLYGPNLSVFVAVIMVMTGLLMVSNIPFRSFKDIDMKGSVPFMVMVVVVLALVLIAIDPPMLLFLLFAGYGCSGPALRVWSLINKRRIKKKNVDR